MPREKITPKELHNLLIHRIYHEDNLLQQRNYNFITANVFLGAGFVVVAGYQAVSVFAYVIAAFGFLWALFQVSYGKKQVFSTSLWRQKAWMAEKELGTKFDLTLFEFYDTGKTETPFGTISIAGEKNKPPNKSFPYTLPFLPGTNVLFGVIVPWMVATFWFSLTLIMLLLLHKAPLWMVIPIVVTMMGSLLFSLFSSPAYPEGIRDEHSLISTIRE